jgi:hypothetical protein
LKDDGTFDQFTHLVWFRQTSDAQELRDWETCKKYAEEKRQLIKQELLEPKRKMADAPVTLRTRKFLRNPLLNRKQMVM